MKVLWAYRHHIWAPHPQYYRWHIGTTIWAPHPRLFHDVAPYFTETSLLICPANQWTGFYTIGSTAIKELRSHYSEVLYGVPRRSILVPLIFNLQICDMFFFQ